MLLIHPVVVAWECRNGVVGILTSKRKVRGRETYLRPYKMNPQAVLSAVYAWKCKTPTVLHFSKLIFNGRLCELYSLRTGPHMLPLRMPDLEQLRFYGANEITFPFKIWWAFPIMKPTQSCEFERYCLLAYAPEWFLIWSCEMH